MGVIGRALGVLVALVLSALLAYSSIAEAGYVLIGVAVADRVPGARTAVCYYLAAFLLMNGGAFAIIAQIERTTGSDALAVVRGLARRQPGAAAALALSLLSLAGMPPLAGFAGKVLLLIVAVDGGMTWLAVIAAANMALALYYYVAIIAEMYLKAPPHNQPLLGGPGYTFAAGLSLLGTCMVGVVPGPCIEYIQVLAQRLVP